MTSNDQNGALARQNGKTVLLIAMPTQGDIATPTVKSLIHLTQALPQWGVAFGFTTYEFSDIVFSRNQLMSLFFTEKKYTHLLLLDSDMSFEPETIRRLLRFDADFVAVPYAKKYLDWREIRAKIEAEADLPKEQKTPISTILSATSAYNHILAPTGQTKWRDGFMTVPATGTGLMLLKRAVPETMVAKGAALRKSGMSSYALHEGLDYCDFFSHLDLVDGTLMMGEDQSFCWRWKHLCDGEIWLDTEAKVTHHGKMGFYSRYGDQIGTKAP